MAKVLTKDQSLEYYNIAFEKACTKGTFFSIQLPFNYQENDLTCRKNVYMSCGVLEADPKIIEVYNMTSKDNIMRMDADEPLMKSYYNYNPKQCMNIIETAIF